MPTRVRAPLHLPWAMQTPLSRHAAYGPWTAGRRAPQPQRRAGHPPPPLGLVRGAVDAGGWGAPPRVRGALSSGARLDPGRLPPARDGRKPQRRLGLGHRAAAGVHRRCPNARSTRIWLSTPVAAARVGQPAAGRCRRVRRLVGGQWLAYRRGASRSSRRLVSARLPAVRRAWPRATAWAVISRRSTRKRRVMRCGGSSTGIGAGLARSTSRREGCRGC